MTVNKNEVVAFFGTGDDEGICAIYSPLINQWIPMVSSDAENIETFRQHAKRIVKDNPGKVIEMRRFTNCEVVEVIQSEEA